MAEQQLDNRKKQTLQAQDLVNVEGRRLDGRLLEECRPGFLQMRTVSRAAGSAYMEFGGTKCMVAVYGPREANRSEGFSSSGRLNCDVQLVPFGRQSRGISREASDAATEEQREYSGVLQRTLEGAVARSTFPKATLDVFALLLESGGSDLATIITCSSAALADAGIEMEDLVTAVSAVRVGSHVLLDPSGDEERNNDGAVLVACMASRGEVTQLAVTGDWPQAQVGQTINLCVAGCDNLDAWLREQLKAQAAAGGDAG
eukprot:TRINITY_DN9980_c0_g1_i2.p1 TRINITY_DN9980_c0_g1~~TRINITY_DN9980_c0_g1_i2.p1  ORF type:complete len:259 (-),score=51.73 TRINITY_DN9980_c0_g1_i2:644-1420(-)